MRSSLVIALGFGLLAACGNESKSREPPAQSAEKNPVPNSDANTAIPQPAGESLRVAVGDCYGAGGAAWQMRRQQVTDKLRGETTALAACYKKSLAADPQSHGGLTLSLTANRAGQLVAATATDFPDPDLRNCVSAHVVSLSLDPTDADVPVSCRLGFGYAPVKVLAEASTRIDLNQPVAEVDWASAGKLPILRAGAEVPSSVVLGVIASARAAGVEHLAFETQRKGEWKFAYLPILPSVEPRGPTSRVQLTVFLEPGRVRVEEREGKTWQIPHAGPEPNYKMLSDVLKARKAEPDYAHRNDIELAPAAQVSYGDLTNMMSLLAAQEFTHVTLSAWPDAAVKNNAPNEK